MKLGRRQFLRGTGTCVAGAGAVAMGFTPPFAHALETRQYKLLRAKQTRNNCCYCSVGCGLLMYGMGDGAINAKASIFHIEGDPDHPVNRGSLCPKGAGLIDFIHSKTRITKPAYRAPGATEWQDITWDKACKRIARLLKDDRDKNFVERNEKGQLVNRWLTTGMLGSSAASSETGTITWKFARALSMLCFDNQARTCHGPTVAALGSTFGRGSMSNNWVDIRNADMVLVYGGNAAEAHPVGFKWAVQARLRNKAPIVVVDPRFNRTAAVADFYAPIRAGSDGAFLLGIMRYLLDHDKIQHDYVRDYTNASFIVRPDYEFSEGLFSGWQGPGKYWQDTYDKTSWNYVLDKHGYALRDETFQNPRCVINLLKKHVERFTPDVVSEICGTPKKDFLTVCEAIASCSAPDKTMTWLYALGFTHHTNGTQIIRGCAMIQLLLGNMGMPGGGVNALRGHSNIQGFTDLGLLSLRLPGYMNLPPDHQQDLQSYLTEHTLEPEMPFQVDLWQNFPAYFVSLMKTLWGDKAQKSNNWGYDWLPKWDQSYDLLAVMNMMGEGKLNGYIAQGFNPLGSSPDKNETTRALSKLKFLVTLDPLNTETANFWKHTGEYNDVPTADIKTEVFRLPTTCFAEEYGSIVNSARWLQWHWKGADAPGEAWGDMKILSRILHELRALYRKEGGPGAASVLNMQWNYQDPLEPTPEEVAKENNGYALEDIRDAHGNLLLKRGQLLPDSLHFRADGSTSSFNWVFAGSWTEAGNQMARRDNADTGWGCTPGWAWAWPDNCRVLYNRACADPMGKAWDPRKQYIFWDGEKWTGADAADYPVNQPPGPNAPGPFIDLAEGVGRLFTCKSLVDGPFPEHYEPMETPLEKLPYPTKTMHDPAVRLYEQAKARMGSPKDFPYVATTYSITELFRTWTKHARINAILQPQQFIEVSEELAKSLGIAPGDQVKVTSHRGYIKGIAVVTKRMGKLNVMGKALYQIGVPSNWGFIGATKPGFLSNTLTPAVGDANTQTPEFKAFLVNIEKSGPGNAALAKKEGV
ncbi:formate dehydrogenase-N subunit alpha [Formicincola oecophyllae]|uniref:Formate dehydrogenase-N subunit alpha n=1 Tax=Formicincola oecophyllae TaxID=2558361 RepID=A0A4Y6UA18_9PROT|nr:formate dehydrogenase-N subunit alpha [Formicincola oecophyllae]QDH14313.1 formate dehydrogenase-N subunit alpha [Formicincola oecophyllae]